jgi:protein involved in polysaccharide export with SLBB domain
MPGLRRTVVALVAITSTASAQPLPDPPSSDPRSTRSEAKIPVTLPTSGEVLGGAVPGSTVPGGEPIAPVPPAAPAPLPLSLESPIDPETYVCGPGDVFELDFWGVQNFRLKLTTDLEGRAFIAKVGFVTVAAKTLSAVRAAVKAKVRANYPGLSFDLTLVSPRSFVVHVVDNVKQPGAYTSRALDRVSTVIAKAGVTNGSRRRIAITHHDGTTGMADLVRYELTGDVAFNPFLLDGDVLTVPFATPVVTISGAIRRPARYELVATKDLAELLDLAGGFTSGVSRALPLQLIRRNAQQQEVVTELPFAGDAAPNTPLRDDDRIIVRGSEDLQRTVLVIGAIIGADPLDSATTSRRIPYVDGDTALSLIDRAGGIKAPGDLRRSYISRPRPNQPPELIPLDLEALLVRRDFRADRPVKMDDTIVVPPRQYSVLVEGAVVRAGLYNYNPTFGVAEYIAHAGGLTRTARDLDETQLIDTDGHTHPFRPGTKPAPGDAILVPERNFSRSEVAQLILAGASLVISGIAVTIAATR